MRFQSVKIVEKRIASRVFTRLAAPLLRKSASVPHLRQAIHVLLICMMSGGFIYIMTNRRNGTLYVSVTSDLVRRCHEHRNVLIRGFKKQYDLKQLVYFEQHDDIRSRSSERK